MKKIKSVLPLLMVLAVACTLPSCKSHNNKKGASGIFSAAYFDAEDFANQLSATLKPIDLNDSLYKKKKLIGVSDALRVAYQDNEYNSFWANKDGLSPAVEAFTKDLDSLRFDGLDPEWYQLVAIKTQYASLKNEKQPSLEKLIAFDTLCTKSYLAASRDILLGKLVPKKVDSLWFHANDSSWTAYKTIVEKLGDADDYPSFENYRSSITVYATLRNTMLQYDALNKDSALLQLKSALNETNADSVGAAIITKELHDLQYETNDTIDSRKAQLIAYQHYYKLKGTGKYDSATIATLRKDPAVIQKTIAVNLERLRWLPRKFEEQYVLVNVPLMELKYKNKGELLWRMKVVVGRPSRQTPSLSANMANIVFNPSWGVPPTILKKDVLPGLTKSGEAYLRKKGLRAYDRNGNPVDAGSINETNYKRFVYKQPPGDDNSLGVVKFNLPNQWDIYLHDTPHKEDFPKSYRALSSGCVRVEKPREFANFILTVLDSNEKYTPGHIDSLVSTHKTRYEVLKHKIPVHIVYLTVFEDSTGSKVNFLHDIYKRDARVATALAN